MKILCLIGLILTGLNVFAQNTDYEGVIQLPGIPLEVKLSLDDEKTQGSMDIPMQKAEGLKLTSFRFEDDSLYFEAPDVPGKAYFKTVERNDSLLGRFCQMGKSFPFAATRQSSQFSIDSLRNKLQALLDKSDVPGISVGIIYKGDIILNEGFGYAHLENKTKVDENTVFAIGSCSKAFTAALVSQCVEEELITWDEPVRPYLPGFDMKDPDARNINAEDLLTHRSGLPRHDLFWYGSELSREELIRKIKLLDYTKPFRTSFQYQNLMYLSAGVLAANLKNTTWENLVQKEIFDPLDMKNTTAHLDGMTSAENRAYPYAYIDEKNQLMPYRNIDAIGPAGSINSTSTDMLKWLQVLLNKGKYDHKTGSHMLLRKASMEKMTSRIINMNNQSSSKHIGPMFYGMGWMINDYKHKKMVHHGGNIDGFTANIMFMPHEDLGVVVLSNANGSNLPTMLTLSIADMVLGLEETDWYAFMNPFEEAESGEEGGSKDKKSSKKSSGKEAIEHYFPLKDYAGTYTSDVYGLVEINYKNDSLLLDFNSFTYHLTHRKMEIFSATELAYGESQNIIFRTDMNGDLSYLEMHTEPSLPAYKFDRKVGDDLLSEDYLSKFKGTYMLDDLEIKMFLRDGKLWSKVKGQGEFELKPSAPNKFKLALMEAFGVEFVTNKKGKVTGIITHQPNGDFEGKKID